MFRRRFRRRPAVYWIGNSTTQSQGVTVLQPGVPGASNPRGLQVQLFTMENPDTSAMNDVMQFGCRIRRLVGNVNLRAVSSGTPPYAFAQVQAAIVLLEQANTGVSWDNVTGGSTAQQEFIDMMNWDANQGYPWWQRRILWWRLWNLASAEPASPASADYVSTTQSFLTPSKTAEWDLKVNIPLQSRGGTGAPRRMMPTLLVQYAVKIGDSNLSITVDSLAWRTLFQPMTGFTRR